MPRTRTARPAVADPDAIRARLVVLVERDGRSQSAIAESAGMSRAQFGQILTGVRVSPSAPTVGRILAALGLPWSALDG